MNDNDTTEGINVKATLDTSNLSQFVSSDANKLIEKMAHIERVSARFWFSFFCYFSTISTSVHIFFWISWGTSGVSKYGIHLGGGYAILAVLAFLCVVLGVVGCCVNRYNSLYSNEVAGNTLYNKIGK